MTEDLRLTKKRQGLELLWCAQGYRDLQVCVGEGNNDSRLISSQ